MKVRNSMTTELSNSALVVIMVINTFLCLMWLCCFLWGHWLQWVCVCVCMCVCVCVCVWTAQTCLTLCDPMNCSIPGSSLHRIFQRILKRVATAKLRCWDSSLSKLPDSDSLAWDVPMVTVWHPAWLALAQIVLLLLLLLSGFSRVRLYVTPEMAAHKAPLSLGFSRQEHWSRLPLPSPMHGSAKWKWSRSVVSDS